MYFRGRSPRKYIQYEGTVHAVHTPSTVITMRQLLHGHVHVHIYMYTKSQHCCMLTLLTSSGMAMKGSAPPGGHSKLTSLSPHLMLPYSSSVHMTIQNAYIIIHVHVHVQHVYMYIHVFSNTRG